MLHLSLFIWNGTVSLLESIHFIFPLSFFSFHRIVAGNVCSV